MTKANFILIGLLLSATAISLALMGCRANGKPALQSDIAKLRSADFQSSRQAQLRIISAGKPALPQLVEAMRSSDNPQQIGLCCYLIGEIDSEAYKSALMEFGVSGKLCTVLRYPNQEAIRKMPKDERQELLTYFSKAVAGATKEEGDCVQKLTQSIKDMEPSK